MPRLLPLIVAAVAILPLCGCGGPDYSRLSDERLARNIQLERELDQARQQLRDQQATAALLTDQLDQRAPRLATLPQARLDQLFSVTHVEIQTATDTWDFDGNGTLDGFRVFFRPLMSNDDVLPETGVVTIEAFDLAITDGPQRIGSWTFQPADLKDKWYGSLGLNHFAVNCPWTQLPAHREITFKIQFVDALTERVFIDQKLISVHLSKPAS